MSERSRRLMDDLDAGRFRNRDIGNVFADFWCDTCRAWTPKGSDNHHETEDGIPFCARCGEQFQCGECGYQIDQEGNCLGPESHG